MPWVVEFHDEFAREFQALASDVQDEMLAQAGRLARFGPTLGRPAVDTIKGSRIGNLKECGSMPAAGSGAFCSPLTNGGSRCCSRGLTSVVSVKIGSTRR